MMDSDRDAEKPSPRDAMKIAFLHCVIPMATSRWENLTMTDLTPRKSVSELDRFLSSARTTQTRPLAVALRNRGAASSWAMTCATKYTPRTFLNDRAHRRSVKPKNQPAGLAKRRGRRSSKVESYKVTEVGYVGRDV